MKTAIEILEGFHDQSLAKLLEAKVNLGGAERRSIITKPGDDYNEIQKAIANFKKSIKNLTIMLEVIDGMIKEEKENKK